MDLVANQHAADRLREWGLTLPGAHLKSPWPGHADLAVRDKTFAYLSTDGVFSLGCKLPFTGEQALEEAWCEPMGYGLAKSGWVSAKPKGDIDLDRFKDWIDESYRAQAPKSLVKQLASRG